MGGLLIKSLSLRTERGQWFQHRTPPQALHSKTSSVPGTALPLMQTAWMTLKKLEHVQNMYKSTYTQEKKASNNINNIPQDHPTPRTSFSPPTALLSGPGHALHRPPRSGLAGHRLSQAAQRRAGSDPPRGGLGPKRSVGVGSGIVAWPEGRG